MIFSLEKATVELCKEMWPLLEQHYKEISVPEYKDIQKLVPDFDRYLRQEQLGFLRVFTLRELNTILQTDGKPQPRIALQIRPDLIGRSTLLGYWVWFVEPNAHYNTTVQASGDVLFVRKDLRGFGSGAKFMLFCFEQLKKEGVQIIHTYCKAKEGQNLSKLFERWGFEQLDLHFSKRIN